MIHEDPRLRDRAPVFRDRIEGGRALADLLAVIRPHVALVLAIPAGGVPVGIEIARKLALELDIAPVSKILLPWTTEAGFGAVAFDGSAWVNDRDVRHYGLSASDVADATAAARAKVERRVMRLCGAGVAPAVTGRPVMLVDDGVAAGSTMRVALSAIRAGGAARMIVAVPTGHRRSIELLAGFADEVFCANIRAPHRYAVADAYEIWQDVSDAEAETLLKEHRKGTA